MFLDSLERTRFLLFWASKIIKNEWLTRKLWWQTSSKGKSSTWFHNVFILLTFHLFPLNFLDFYWFSIDFLLISPRKSFKTDICVKKKALWNQVELFPLLVVCHHNFLVNHSFCMILDAQKSRNRALSNESKNINFPNGKIFSRTRWKKVSI